MALGSVLINVDGLAWFSGSPDPTVFDQESATHVWINVDGTAGGWKEAVAVYINTDGNTNWRPAAPPAQATITASDTSFCVSTTPHYQVGNSVTNIPTGADFEVRGWRSTSGDAGYVLGTPSFTVAEGDGGACWGYYEVRTKLPYTDWGSWNASNHVHVIFKSCGRPV